MIRGIKPALSFGEDKYDEARDKFEELKNSENIINCFLSILIMSAAEDIG
jgi:hypothetical protein